MSTNQKSKSSPKHYPSKNVVESLKDIGSAVTDSVFKDVIRPEDILEQILARQRVRQNYSGEISPGEAVEMNDVLSGEREKQNKLKEGIRLERQLLEEEKRRVEEKSQQLKIQLHTLINEINYLASSTGKLSQEVQTAAFQAPVEPGVYHLIFFEKLLEFIKSLRKKVDEACVWLQSTNKRAEKKNFWAMYKKKGSSFLLSSDHYLQRSAG